jgi:hypothetical protein
VRRSSSCKWSAACSRNGCAMVTVFKSKKEISDKKARRFRVAARAIASGILWLSVGCGGGNVTPPIVAPTHLVYPQGTITAAVGTAMSTDAPTVTGTVGSYAVSPTLPAGLSLNTSTGTISGTPTTVTPQANYTVTASNSGGSTTAILQITVNAAAPSNLVYPQGTIIANVGTPIAPDIPTVTGTVGSYGVSPALPAGLSLNTSTGIISGTPSVAAPQGIYKVMASNSGGSSTANVTITVNAALNVLLELGHAAPIEVLRLSQSRLLSEDQNGHWVLWNYSSSAMLASGDGANAVDMAGQVVVIGRTNGLEIRAASDGYITATIVAPGVSKQPVAEGGTWWQLASDGSYVCVGSPAGIVVWTTTGQIMASRAGDYSAAITFAAPGVVQVALGPAGQNVVETVSSADGTSTVSRPFSGSFLSWFVDGQRFLSTLSDTVWTYSKTGVQQAVVQLPTVSSLTGQGNWLWTFSQVGPVCGLEVYAIGSDTPAFSDNPSCLDATDELTIPSALTIGLLPYGTAAISVIDLSGPTPLETDSALPIAYGSAYAAVSSSQWVSGNMHGVLLDGTSLTANVPSYFGLGEVWSIAGSTNQVAISTAAGTIFYFDPTNTTPEATISFSSGKVALSSDGSVLGASGNANDAQYEPDGTLKIFSVPSGNLINSFPYTNIDDGDPELFDFTLSDSGTILGQVSGMTNTTNWIFLRQVTATTGGPVIWSDNPQGGGLNADFGPDPILLSPDATLIAVSSGPNNPNSTTSIYKNGTLVTAVPGFGIGWIDNDRLLVNNYGRLEPAGEVYYINCTIYSATGTVLATPALPELYSFQTVGPDSVYSPYLNTIFSVTTGQATWTGPSTSPFIQQQYHLGAATSSYVVFPLGSQVVVDPY